MSSVFEIAMRDMGRLIDLANANMNTIPEVINVKGSMFGAKGDGKTDDLWAIDKAIAVAKEKGGIVYFPPGTYIMSSYPSELRQSNITGTLDLNNLVIVGAGRTTILKGISEKGHDVLQLNGVKNLTVRDLAITSVKTNPSDTTQGCNGISMTNGTNNIIIENVYVYDLPYVVRASSVDGGKAFTIQQGFLGVEACANIKVINCESNNTPFGFSMDIPGSGVYQPYGIEIVNNTFRSFYRGISASASAPGSGSYVEKLMMAAIGNVIIGAQQGINIGRVGGIFFGNQIYSEKTATPTEIPYDTTVVPIVLLSCENTVVKNNFVYYARCDNYVRIGGTVSGASQFCAFKDNQFTGNSEGAGILAVNFGGNSVRNSVFANNTFRNVTTIYDSLLYHMANDNIIITNDASTRFDKLGIGTTGDFADVDIMVNGVIGLAGADGKTAFHFIQKNGVSIGLKQTGSSSPTAKVISAISHQNADVGGFLNNGAIYSNAIENNAVPATQNKRLPVYDASGAFAGYIPLYTS